MARPASFDPSLMSSSGGGETNPWVSFAAGFLGPISMAVSARVTQSQARDERAFETMSFMVRSREASPVQRAAAMTVLSGMQNGSIKPQNALKVMSDLHAKVAKPELQKAFDRMTMQIRSFQTKYEAAGGEGGPPSQPGGASGDQISLMTAGTPQPGAVDQPKTPAAIVASPTGKTIDPQGPPAAPGLPGPDSVVRPPVAPTPAPAPAPVAPATPTPPPSPIQQRIQITQAGIDSARQQLQRFRAKANYLADPGQLPPGMGQQDVMRMQKVVQDTISDLDARLAKGEASMNSLVTTQVTQAGAERRHRESQRGYTERFERGQEGAIARHKESLKAGAARENRQIIREAIRAGASLTKAENTRVMKAKEDLRKLEQGSWKTHAAVVRSIRGERRGAGGSGAQDRVATAAARHGLDLGILGAVVADELSTPQRKRINNSYVNDYLITAFDADPDMGQQMLADAWSTEKTPGGLWEVIQDELAPDPDVIMAMIRSGIPPHWDREDQLTAYRNMLAAFVLQRDDVIFGGRATKLPPFRSSLSTAE